MRWREASINDVPIAEADRLFRWPLGYSRKTIQASAISACRRHRFGPLSAAGRGTPVPPMPSNLLRGGTHRHMRP